MVTNKKGCAVKGCSRPAHALGMCRTHYDRQKKAGRSVVRAKSAPAPKCSVPACSRPSYAQGLCQMHYEARRKGLGGLRSGGGPSKTCGVPGCTAPHHAKGYCKSHYGRLLRRKGGEGVGAARTAGLCEIAGCTRVATKDKRCEEHREGSLPEGKKLLTRAERLAEIRKRHDRMRKEIERIKESLESEQED